jgi:hypothetical protein
MRHLCGTQGGVLTNIIIRAKPPMQAPEPEGRPRMKLEALIWNSVPENVMEIGVLKLQGTFQTSINRCKSETNS